MDLYGAKHRTTDCPQCYNATTRRDFWGFSIAIIVWEQLVGPTSQLGQLSNQGYRWELRSPDPNRPEVEIVIATSKTPPKAKSNFVVVDIQTRGQNAPPTPSKSFTDTWTLYVIPEDEWIPSWRAPTIAGVVIGSVLVAILICSVLVNRMQHIMALQELKESNKCLEETTRNLKEEKQRLDALLVRQYNLINMFEGHAGNKTPENSTQDGRRISREDSAVDRIEALRRSMARNPNAGMDDLDIKTLQMLGEGTFGKVYKGIWRGTVVAVKTLVLPANMSGAEKREKMAIMEAAISSSLSHPNIVQTYTYAVKPMRDNVRLEVDPNLIISANASSAVLDRNTLDTSNEASKGIHSFEVRLVLEYCDKGNLRDAIDQGVFFCDNGLNYRGILDTALDIAKAMLHLHSCNVLHGDLKARNVMMKSSGADDRGVQAKVGDFGLSIKMDHMETHVSSMFQGTLTHMAPEIMLHGHVSKAADVYAFGITLYELFTGGQPFKGVARALLGHAITKENKRPSFSPITPLAYKQLAEQCWHKNPALRPTFEDILTRLSTIRNEVPGMSPPLKIEVVLPETSGTGSAAASPKAGPANASPSGVAALPMFNGKPGGVNGQSSAAGPSAGTGNGGGGTVTIPMSAIIIGDGNDAMSIGTGGAGFGGSIARSIVKGVTVLPRIEEGSDRKEGTRTSSDPSAPCMDSEDHRQS